MSATWLFLTSRTGVAIATWIGTAAAVVGIVVTILIAVLAPPPTVTVIAPGPLPCCCREPDIRTV